MLHRIVNMNSNVLTYRIGIIIIILLTIIAIELGIIIYKKNKK